MNSLQYWTKNKNKKTQRGSQEMKTCGSYNWVMLTFLMNTIDGFFFKPVFLHGVSCSLNLVLLFFLLVLWSCQKIKKGNMEGKKHRLVKRISLHNHNIVLLTCVCVSVLNLVMCSLSFFVWSQSSLSSTNLDFVTKTVSWIFLSIYFYSQFSHPSESKYPLLLRFWRCFYFFISLYSFIIDIVLFKRHVLFPIAIQSLVSDIVSVITSLILLYFGVLKRNNSEDNSLLEEPLLNKVNPRGDETVTPYSKAGFFNCLAFSWIGPLIADGYKKTLDLEDLPQLDIGDRVIGIFPILISAIESDCGSIDRVTSFKLAKAIFVSMKREISWMGLLLFISKVASYAGPYLINEFFQYLKGLRRFENEGFVLVSTFITAKIIECFSSLEWFFVARKVRVKACASLIALIYEKSLTLSSRSISKHSSGEIINLVSVDTERIADYALFVHDPWTIILEIAMAMVILYRNLGIAAITTLIAMIIFTLSNLPFGKLQERFQKKLMASKDSRMKAISEVLRNMRILKLQGWEMKFFSKIVGLRKVDISPNFGIS